jgi:3',5'-cyclic AMP phosphodiesterase CpdA
MPRIAHLSDLHFGEAAGPLVESLAADLLAAAPDAIVVSGDLTRDAARDEFAAALAFLGGLGMPLLVVPGNHDIPRIDLWTRFVNPKRRWRRASAALAQDELRLGPLSIIGLDTVSRAQWHLDWSAGAIPRRRRARLAQQLARAAGGDVLVVCHHPLQHAAWAGWRRPPRHAAETIALLAGARLRGVLCGHLHRAAMTQLPATTAVQVIAPSAFSPRGSAAAGGPPPNGWNLVCLDAAGMRVETREFLEGRWQGRALTPE